MQHPKVRTALDNLWIAANTDDRDQLLDKDEYLVMLRKITLALDPTVLPREAVAAAHEDWQRDAEGTMRSTATASAGAGSSWPTFGPSRSRRTSTPSSSRARWT